MNKKYMNKKQLVGPLILFSSMIVIKYDNYRDVFRTQWNIYDGAFLLTAVNYFHKISPSWMFEWVVNTRLNYNRPEQQNILYLGIGYIFIAVVYIPGLL